MTNTSLDNNTRRAWGIGLVSCLTALLAISFSIVLRIEPSLMQNDLQKIFHLSPEKFGELFIRYQYSLIATLLFAGLIVDYFGTRRILVLAIIGAVIGNYLFSKATTVPAMIHGRILIGYAHPFILISALKLGTQWVPKKHFSIFAGLLFATLLMTPVILKSPLSNMIDALGMSIFADLLNIIGILAVAILLLTRKPQGPFYVAENIRFRNILAVLTNTEIWSICAISCLGWMANTFLLNYGMIFLIKNHGFNHAYAAETINTAFMCFALGAIITGFISEFLLTKRLLVAIGYIIAAITFSIVLYIPHLDTAMASGLIFATGFFTGTAVMCYAKAYDFSTPINTGCAFALVAFATTLGNTLFTFLLGNLLEAELPKLSTSHSLTWQILLASIPSALAIGAILAIRLRKNHQTPLMQE
jgi:predicted MFS family arabinose efflux permease